MNHVVSAILVTEHLDDLFREAEEARRSNLVRGARRSAWSAFSERLAGFRGRSQRPEGNSRSKDARASSSNPRPAAA